MKKVLLGAAAVIALALLGALLYAWSGRFDIGADSAHSAPVHALLGFARERAIEARAASLAVPALDDPKLIAGGASEYAEMCAGCHLAPGMEDNELRPGLYPQPPNLAEAGAHPAGTGTQQQQRQLAARQFWVIKHGIKLTAMPAWGLTHDDDTLWSIVAFLQKLPTLTPEQYAALTANAETEHHAAGHDDGDEAAPHHHHDHGHEEPAAKPAD